MMVSASSMALLPSSFGSEAKTHLGKSEVPIVSTHSVNLRNRSVPASAWNRSATSDTLLLQRQQERTQILHLEASSNLSKIPYVIDLFDVTDCKSIACHIKKEFDKNYGIGWQCVVGFKFGCYFTHAEGTFVYFGMENLNFLIFKGA